jgi:hypothetical protein
VEPVGSARGLLAVAVAERVQPFGVLLAVAGQGVAEVVDVGFGGMTSSTWRKASARCSSA